MTAPPRSARRAVILYSLNRLWLFLASFLMLRFVLGGFWLLAGSLVVSAVLALLLLRRQRDEVAAVLAARRESRQARGVPLDQDRRPGPGTT